MGLEFIAVESVNIQHTRNELRKLVPSAVGSILFHLRWHRKEHFVVKNVRTILLVITLPALVKSAEKHLNYPEEIWKEAEGIFVPTDVI